MESNYAFARLHLESNQLNELAQRVAKDLLDWGHNDPEAATRVQGIEIKGDLPGVEFTAFIRRDRKINSLVNSTLGKTIMMLEENEHKNYKWVKVLLDFSRQYMRIEDGSSRDVEALKMFLTETCHLSASMLDIDPVKTAERFLSDTTPKRIVLKEMPHDKIYCGRYEAKVTEDAPDRDLPAGIVSEYTVNFGEKQMKESLTIKASGCVTIRRKNDPQFHIDKLTKAILV